MEAYRQSKVALFYKLWAIQAPFSLLIYFLYFLLLMSINGPRWLPASAIRFTFQATERKKDWGKGTCQLAFKTGPWRYDTSFLFRSHHPALRYVAPYNCKGTWETNFFSFLFWGKKSSTLLLWKREESLLVVSQQSQTHCSPTFEWSRGAWGRTSLKMNWNKADRRSFRFCTHSWSDGQFICALWGKTFLPLSFLHLLWSPFRAFKTLKLWIKCKCSLRILVD